MPRRMTNVMMIILIGIATRAAALDEPKSTSDFGALSQHVNLEDSSINRASVTDQNTTVAATACTQSTCHHQTPLTIATQPVRNLACRMRNGCGLASRIGILRRVDHCMGSCMGSNCQPPRGPDTQSPDLFYNYYQPANAGATHAARMYPAPHPTHPVTGQTYFTYQPFLPHEYMYTHNRSYYRMYNRNRGFNRTHVTYKPNAATSMRQLFQSVFEPAR